MKTEDLKNLNLEGIVNALQEQNLMKHDIVVPARYLRMKNTNLQVINSEKLDDFTKLLADTGIMVSDIEKEMIDLSVLDCCHAQIASRCDIPKRYYDRMLESTQSHNLLDSNVSHWLENKSGNYLLRTFIDKSKSHGIARAVLSDRYSVMDNYDVMLATLDAIKESGINVKIESGDITDTKFYMRFTCPDIEVDAPDLLKNYRVPNSNSIFGDSGGSVGNGIISGFVISNSETGNGKFSISPRALVLACKNGMIFKDDAFMKTHLGAKMDEYSSIDWSEDTRQKNYELVCSQVKDAIKHYASYEYLSGKVQQLIVKGNKELVNPIETVMNVSKHLSVSDEKEKSILNYFIKGGDTTAFGVTQALTYFAHQHCNPEERYEMEIKAVEVLEEINTFDVPSDKLKVNTKFSVN